MTEGDGSIGVNLLQPVIHLHWERGVIGVPVLPGPVRGSRSIHFPDRQKGQAVHGAFDDETIQPGLAGGRPADLDNATVQFGLEIEQFHWKEDAANGRG